MSTGVDSYAATVPTATCADTWPGLPIEEAARVLGVSSSTIRRWVRQGRLRSEKIARPQGHVVRVHLPDRDAGQLSPQPSEQIAEQPPERQLPTWTPEQQRAESMATYNRLLVEPLVTRMAEQEAAIRELEREVGRLMAENRALAASTATNAPDLTPAQPLARWRLLEPWLLAAVSVAVAVVVLLVVPW